MTTKAAQPNNPYQMTDTQLRERVIALELKVEQLTKALKEQGLGSIESGWLRDNNTKLNK
tara:strand:- start:131 stop:310 length:180 start_codon:yes stop_codon:yes gene_type:complete